MPPPKVRRAGIGLFAAQVQDAFALFHQAHVSTKRTAFERIGGVGSGDVVVVVMSFRMGEGVDGEDVRRAPSATVTSPPSGSANNTCCPFWAVVMASFTSVRPLVIKGGGVVVYPSVSPMK